MKKLKASNDSYLYNIPLVFNRCQRIIMNESDMNESER